jgi:VWFA-related protein
MMDRTRGRVAIAVAAALVVWMAGTSAARQQPPFTERVDVERVLVDVRVLEAAGRPVVGLEASDFAVRIGGRAARVESAEWIGSRPEVDGRAGDQVTGRAEPPTFRAGDAGSPGRLVVFLVQRDLQPLRITGLMQIAPLIDSLLAPFTPDDRLAVLSFDSHLRFWSDFTGDVERIRAILGSHVISGRPGGVSQAGDVSLMARLTADRARRIHGVEHALRHVAEALEPLPGAKSLVLLGYGFGRFTRNGVILMDGYREASVALQRARVSVFSLNVTRAHYNSLQAGLETVSAETGGTYASTFEFPAQAVERVAHALAGHYVLFVEPPDLRPGTHRIDVRLTNRAGRVIARSSYLSPAGRSR